MAAKSAATRTFGQMRHEGTLEGLLNLGPASAAWLRDAGIATHAELATVGSVEAWFRVKALGVNPSLNLLWALEGALSNRHFAKLDRDTRESLLRDVDARMDLIGKPGGTSKRSGKRTQP